MPRPCIVLRIASARGDFASTMAVITIGVSSPALRVSSTAFRKSRSTFSARMCAPARTVQAIALHPASAAVAIPSSMLAHCRWRETRHSRAFFGVATCARRPPQAPAAATSGTLPSSFRTSRREWCVGHRPLLTWVRSSSPGSQDGRNSSSLPVAPRSTINAITSFQSFSVPRIDTACSTAWHSPQTLSTALLPGPSGSPPSLAACGFALHPGTVSA